MEGAVAYPGFVGGIFDDYMRRHLTILSQDWRRIEDGFYLPNCEAHLNFRGLLFVHGKQAERFSTANHGPARV